MIEPHSHEPVTTNVVELEGFGRIFEVYHYGNEPEQTQRLIESAPELLGALETMLNQAQSQFNCGDKYASYNKHTIELIRQTVTKAKGSL